MPDVITAITRQKKNQNRFSIFIDEAYAFSLSRELAQTLQCGNHLDPSRIDDLKQADAPERAFARALYFLNFRPRSRTEVEVYLSGKGFSQDAAESAIIRLENLGYLNDREFARMWIEHRSRLNPKGAHVLKGELRQKGIKEAIIRELLKTLDERELAWKAAVPKLRRMKTLEKNDFIKKLGAFLIRRGFPYPICREICDQAWDHPNFTEYPNDGEKVETI